jgi:riboflavin synthase
MFTGIVEEMGRVTAITELDDGEDLRLAISSPRIFHDAALGASIAVNGVCLTITSILESAGVGTVTFDVMPQTMHMTSLGDLKVGDEVNLERALLASGRLDGHVVQGHVDGVATLRSRTPGPRWDNLRFDLPANLHRYVAPQGSIAVGGVSLTVTDVDDDGFGVSLIPTTLDVTTLGRLVPGDRVNIEVDVLAKYVERMLRDGHSERMLRDGGRK